MPINIIVASIQCMNIMSQEARFNTTHVRKCTTLIFVTYFATPKRRSRSCFPGIHHSGKSWLSNANNNRSSKLGCKTISCLSFLNISRRSRTLLAFSSVIGSGVTANDSEIMTWYRGNRNKINLAHIFYKKFELQEM